jgi:hypothetical protein
MIHRFASAAVAAAIAIPFAGGAIAAPTPRLPKTLSANANDLQRAAWACEAGAPVLDATAGHTKAGPARYFLSGAGEAGTTEPPLVLATHRLTGLGWLSDDRGWSTIRFRCALTPDLRQATTFSFTVLAAAKAPAGDPTSGAPPSDAISRSKIWNSDLGAATLTYGVPQTDDIDFQARCTPHGGKVVVWLGNTVEWLKAGGYVVLSLGDGAHSGLYVARGVLNEEAGANMPEVEIPADDPLFSWMASGKTLLINIGRDLAYSVPLAGAARPVRAFATVCR